MRGFTLSAIARSLSALVATITFVLVSVPAVASSSSCGGNSPTGRAYALHLAMTGHKDEAERIAPTPLFRAIVEITAHAPDAALDTLRQMSMVPQTPESQAEIAFWAARADRDSGHPAAANDLTHLAQQYGQTFYGQLAGGAATSDITRRYIDANYLYVDPRVTKPLLLAVIRTESRFNIGATSRTGAQGLMQIMGPTAQTVAAAFGTTADLHRINRDAHYNVAIGSTYLGYLYVKYSGNIPLTLAAYNAGPGCADHWISSLGDPRLQSTVDPVLWIESVPYAETRDYIKKVLVDYMIYQKLQDRSPKTKG